MRILPFFFYWLLFTLLYLVVPNTKVKFVHVLFAGIICGTAFQLFQYLYINGQINLSQYNTVYGAFAAIPLFFFWLQISWLIVLYGAELSFVSQNLKDKYYEYDKDKISRCFYGFCIDIDYQNHNQSFRREYASRVGKIYSQQEQSANTSHQRLGQDITVSQHNSGNNRRQQQLIEIGRASCRERV